MTTPARAARLRAGLSIEEAAKRARVSADYLRRIDRSGNSCSFRMAQRLSRLYGCSMNVFVTKSGQAGSERGEKSPASGNAGGDGKRGKGVKNGLLLSQD